MIDEKFFDSVLKGIKTNKQLFTKNPVFTFKQGDLNARIACLPKITEFIQYKLKSYPKNIFEKLRLHNLGETRQRSKKATRSKKLIRPPRSPTVAA